MMRSFPLLFLTCCLLQGCADPLKLLQKGQSQRAYEVSKRRVARAAQNLEPLKDKDKEALALSYTQLQDEQLSRIETIENSLAPDRYIEIYPLYQELLKYRTDVALYLPWVPELKPRHDISELQQRVEHARQKAGAYYHDEAARLFAAARKGEKPIAQMAHSLLEKSLRYVPESAENQRLKQEMKDLGTTNIVIYSSAGVSFNDQKLSDYLITDDNLEHYAWTAFYFSPPSGRIDYVLEVEIVNTYVSSDGESSRSDSYTKEVTDGYKTVDKIHQVNDSTTIVVQEQVPNLITVQGEIRSIDQSKSAETQAHVRLLTAKWEPTGNTWTIRKGTSWSNSYQVCCGDSRALPSSCSGSSGSYPSDLSMLKDLSVLVRKQLFRDATEYLR